MGRVRSLPTVSIVIPASGAGASLPAALRAVHDQTYPNIVDVIVAAADDDSAKAATASGATTVPNPQGRTPTGLNRAIARSAGDVVVRVDARSIIPENYVAQIVEALAETGADNVGGMQVPVGRTFSERPIAAAMRSRAGAGGARYRVGGERGPTDTVYLGAFRRETLERLGGFDERYERHQDYELNQRIRDQGGVVWFDPELRVEYRPRSSLKALARQYYDFGKWKRRFARDHPGTLLMRQKAPPTLVPILALSLAGSLLWRPLLLLPASYAAALIAAGLTQLRTAGPAALGAPAALATMHLAWGLGFLVGQTKERQNESSR